ncbi:hypothetical protein ACWEFL_22900 [Streptomyces sp. NPDC004838]
MAHSPAQNVVGRLWAEEPRSGRSPLPLTHWLLETADEQVMRSVDETYTSDPSSRTPDGMMRKIIRDERLPISLADPGPGPRSSLVLTLEAGSGIGPLLFESSSRDFAESMVAVRAEMSRTPGPHTLELALEKQWVRTRSGVDVVLVFPAVQIVTSASKEPWSLRLAA